MPRLPSDPAIPRVSPGRAAAPGLPHAGPWHAHNHLAAMPGCRPHSGPWHARRWRLRRYPPRQPPAIVALRDGSRARPRNARGLPKVAARPLPPLCRRPGQRRAHVVMLTIQELPSRLPAPVPTAPAQLPRQAPDTSADAHHAGPVPHQRRPGGPGHTVARSPGRHSGSACWCSICCTSDLATSAARASSTTSRKVLAWHTASAAALSVHPLEKTTAA